MSVRTWVLASHSLIHSIERDATHLPSLKEDIATLSGGRVRRVDRYIELCLLGALRCVEGHALPEHTGVYLATRSGAVDTSAEATSSIIQRQQPPKPLHFVNTLGNTACFYLTKSLGIHGQALVISREHLSFEAALFQACIDMELGVVETALVGGIDEVTLPAAQHARRLDAPDAERLLEGSHWLLLSKAVTPSHSATNIAISRPEFRRNLSEAKAYLQAQTDGPVQCSFAPSPQERVTIGSLERPLVTASAAELYRAAAHGVYSGAALVGLVEKQLAGQSSVHLARTSDIYCAIRVIRE